MPPEILYKILEFAIFEDKCINFESAYNFLFVNKSFFDNIMYLVKNKNQDVYYEFNNILYASKILNIAINLYKLKKINQEDLIKYKYLMRDLGDTNSWQICIYGNYFNYYMNNGLPISCIVYHLYCNVIFNCFLN